MLRQVDYLCLSLIAVARANRRDAVLIDGNQLLV